MCEHGLLRIKDDFQLSFLTQPISHSQDIEDAEEESKGNQSLLTTNENSDDDEDDEDAPEQSDEPLEVFPLPYIALSFFRGERWKGYLFKRRRSPNPVSVNTAGFYTQYDDVMDENLYESQLSATMADNNDDDNCTSRPRGEMGRKKRALRNKNQKIFDYR